jgi:hypothetical protein
MRLLLCLVALATLAACEMRPDETDAKQAVTHFSADVGTVPVSRLSFAVTKTTDSDGPPPTRVFLCTAHFLHLDDRAGRPAGPAAGLDEFLSATYRSGDPFTVDYEVVFEKGPQGWRSTEVAIRKLEYGDGRRAGSPR